MAAFAVLIGCLPRYCPICGGGQRVAHLSLIAPPTRGPITCVLCSPEPGHKPIVALLPIRSAIPWSAA